ncbi:hypothetical protein TNCV_4135051 [Trichonephila clavipes]|nr:hypothetical protein TNCV_4135051 [Trichonephila clavipes]
MDVPLKKISSGKKPMKKRFQGDKYLKKSVSENVQGLSSLETLMTKGLEILMCLPNPVSQKAYDRINARIADVSEALANASMKKAAAEKKY